MHYTGRILGDSEKGTCNDSDFMFRMLKVRKRTVSNTRSSACSAVYLFSLASACLLCGCARTQGCAQLGWNPRITWSEVGSPVDYVARAIVYIVRNLVSVQAFTPRANYNLVHPESMT